MFYTLARNSVQIYSAIFYYSNYTQIIIDKLESVAVICIAYIPFAQTPAQTVVNTVLL